MRVLLSVNETLRSQFVHWLNKSHHTIIQCTSSAAENYLQSKEFDLLIIEGTPKDCVSNSIWITNQISAKHKTIQWPFSIATLVTSITVAVSENEYKVNSGFVLDQRRDALFINGYLVHLSKKELDILKFIINKDGGIASRTELLEEVWGMSSSASPRAVDTSIARLRPKLGQYFTKLQSVSGGGYRWVDDE